MLLGIHAAWHTCCSAYRLLGIQAAQHAGCSAYELLSIQAPTAIFLLLRRRFHPWRLYTTQFSSFTNWKALIERLAMETTPASTKVWAFFHATADYLLSQLTAVLHRRCPLLHTFSLPSCLHRPCWQFSISMRLPMFVPGSSTSSYR